MFTPAKVYHVIAIRSLLRWFFLLLLWLSGYQLCAQGELEDFETRTGVAFGTDLYKKFGIVVSHEFRFSENSTMLRRSLSNVGINYEVTDWLGFGAHYRLSYNRQEQNIFSARHRLMLDCVLQQSHYDFTLTYRLRYQHEGRNPKRLEQLGSQSFIDLRNTVKLNYNVSPGFRPYIGYDSRHMLQQPAMEIEPFQDRNRWVCGADIRLKKNRGLGCYLMYARAADGNQLIVRYIVGVEYSFGTSRPKLGT